MTCFYPLSLTIVPGQIVSYRNAQFFTDRGRGHRDLLGYHISLASALVRRASCISIARIDGLLLIEI